MNFSGSHVEPQRDIVESAGADPADAILDGVECREETMALAMTVAVISCARVRSVPLAALPA